MNAKYVLSLAIVGNQQRGKDSALLSWEGFVNPNVITIFAENGYKSGRLFEGSFSKNT